MAVSKAQAIAEWDAQVAHAVSLGHPNIIEQGWTFAFGRGKRTLGLCNYTRRVISISAAFMRDNDIQQVRNTIKHEIAHALAEGDGHGSWWKQTFIRLGGDGEQFNSTAKPSFKWALVDTTKNDEVVAQYFSKPRRNIATLQVNGRPETLGKLKLIEV